MADNSKAAGGPAAPTCDQCRVRKVRCSLTATDEEPRECTNCKRRGEACTFEYTPKKPGRPRAPVSSSGSRKRTREERDGSEQTRSAGPSGQSASSSALNAVDTIGLDEPLGPIFGSIFGSARQTLESIPFDYTLPRTRPSSPPLPLSTLSTTSDELPLLTSLLTADTSPTQSNLLETPLSQSNLHETPLSQVNLHADEVDISRIENFASWEDIGFFLSLHMRHQHMLVPLVHRPSFAQDVLMRRDEGDEAFRGLLMSIVTYTICQCPINRLLGRMDKARLEKLLERCQRGSRMIQLRHQDQPSLVTLASTILDWVSGQAASPPEHSALLMADTRRLIYALGLNRAVPRDDLSPLEIQLCRRLFWEAIAIDGTNALNGHPLNFLQMDGWPPFPLEVDDEYMTSDASSRQPDGKLSFMSGFVYLARIFRILNECLVRHRILVNVDGGGAGMDELGRWVGDRLDEVQGLLAEMPEQLQPGNAEHELDTVFGTQAANLYITALCAELALLDLRAKIVDDNSDKARYEIAQRALRQLERMPLECLASNGESLRGKVLRVILTLLNMQQEGGQLGEGLWDWWNMYSRVQFIQLMPEIRT